MPRYKMIVLTSPVSGKEEEYHHWYQNVHFPEVMAYPGMLGAQRYTVAQRLTGSDTNPFLAIYDMETEDMEGLMAQMGQAAASGEMTTSDAVQEEIAYTVVFEEFGERFDAQP